MTREPTRKVLGDVVCPLFDHLDPPLMASDVGEVKLWLYRDGKKVTIGKKYWWINKDRKKLFTIEPPHTTEEDIGEQFGGGTFWVEARRVGTGSPIPKAHRTFIVQAPIKISEDLEDEESEDDEDEEDDEDQTAKMTDHMFILMRDQNKATERNFREQLRAKEQAAYEKEKLIREANAKEAEMQSTFTLGMLEAMRGNRGDGPTEETVRALRDEISSLRQRHDRELADLQVRMREEASRRGLELDEIKRTHREDLGRKERDFEEYKREARRQLEKETDELKKRYEKETDELKKRYEKDTDELKRRHEKESDDIKDRHKRDVEKLEAKVEELKKDNFALEKDLTETEIALKAAEKDNTSSLSGTDKLIGLLQAALGSSSGQQIAMQVLQVVGTMMQARAQAPEPVAAPQAPAQGPVAPVQEPMPSMAPQPMPSPASGPTPPPPAEPRPYTPDVGALSPTPSMPWAAIPIQTMPLQPEPIATPSAFSAQAGTPVPTAQSDPSSQDLSGNSVHTETESLEEPEPLEQAS